MTTPRDNSLRLNDLVGDMQDLRNRLDLAEAANRNHFSTTGEFSKRMDALEIWLEMWKDSLCVDASGALCPKPLDPDELLASAGICDLCGRSTVGEGYVFTPEEGLMCHDCFMDKSHCDTFAPDETPLKTPPGVRRPAKMARREPEWIECTEEEFRAFQHGHPEMTLDVTGIVSPPFLGIYDFSTGKKGTDALVAKAILHRDGPGLEKCWIHKDWREQPVGPHEEVEVEEVHYFNRALSDEEIGRAWRGSPEEPEPDEEWRTVETQVQAAICPDTANVCGIRQIVTGHWWESSTEHGTGWSARIRQAWTFREAKLEVERMDHPSSGIEIVELGPRFQITKTELKPSAQPEPDEEWEVEPHRAHNVIFHGLKIHLSIDGEFFEAALLAFIKKWIDEDLSSERILINKCFFDCGKTSETTETAPHKPDEEWKAVYNKALYPSIGDCDPKAKDKGLVRLAKLVVQERRRAEDAECERDSARAYGRDLMAQRDRYKEAFEELVGSIRGTNSGVAVHTVRFSDEYIGYLEKKARGE